MNTQVAEGKKNSSTTTLNPHTQFCRLKFISEQKHVPWKLWTKVPPKAWHSQVKNHRHLQWIS